MKYSLRCPVCSTAYAPEKDVLTCGRCDAPTVVVMNITKETVLGAPDDTSMWRYFDLLPLADRRWITSQGEGRTPLVESPRLAETLGVGRLWLKNETVNPTGSFKDRQISLGLSKARESGATTVAVVSSGNVAAAAAD